MEITQTVTQPLHREFRIVIDADDLDMRLTGRLEEMKSQIHLKGFRPGKAPVSFLKKTLGKRVMNEIVEQAVTETSQKAVADNALKPAFPPEVNYVTPLDEVVGGKANLEFTVRVDLMPDFEVTDLTGLKVEKLVSTVSDKDVDESLENLGEQARTYTPRAEGQPAQEKDAVTLDFVGRVDGMEFAGGKAEDFNLVLGSGQLIAGFEDQLIGAKAGEERTVQVTFPEDYPDKNLAGKPAEFSVQVKEVKAPDALAIDDELARKLGLTSLGALRDRVRDQLKQDHNRASRLHLKRRLLDALDARHSFPLPETMVSREFDSIWKQVQDELAREGRTAADEGKTEDELKSEYRRIAERRVRLGLVLARVGEQNGITVSQEELQRAITMRARQYQGQEQEAYNFLSSNPQAQAEIRAPIFEEKVVDFIGELANVTERKVDRETLYLDPDEAEARLNEAEKTPSAAASG
ncbi:MAG TPA: trigger factor [Rhizomicrobium sp.]|jgi:trigger factor|nr:trigger factor [Rhizomicrobium sp.]